MKERLAALQDQAAVAQSKLDEQNTVVERAEAHLTKLGELRERETRLKEKLATTIEQAAAARAKYEARLADVGDKHTSKLQELQTKLVDIQIRELELKDALSAQKAN